MSFLLNEKWPVFAAEQFSQPASAQKSWRPGDLETSFHSEPFLSLLVQIGAAFTIKVLFNTLWAF